MASIGNPRLDSESQNGIGDVMETAITTMLKEECEHIISIEVDDLRGMCEWCGVIVQYLADYETETVEEVAVSEDKLLAEIELMDAYIGDCNSVIEAIALHEELSALYLRYSEEVTARPHMAIQLSVINAWAERGLTLHIPATPGKKPLGPNPKGLSEMRKANSHIDDDTFKDWLDKNFVRKGKLWTRAHQIEWATEWREVRGLSRIRKPKAQPETDTGTQSEMAMDTGDTAPAVSAQTPTPETADTGPSVSETAEDTETASDTTETAPPVSEQRDISELVNDIPVIDTLADPIPEFDSVDGIYGKTEAVRILREYAKAIEEVKGQWPAVHLRLEVKMSGIATSEIGEE